MVGAPFRTMVAPTSEAHSRARAMGSRCISAMLHPVRRANSPICGVSTRGVSQAQIASRSPARALSASASMTAGQLRSRMRRRTSSTVSRWVPKPGPMAMLSAVRQARCISPRARRDRHLTFLTSGSGWVMASVILASSMSLRLLGTPSVTRPAPPLSAAFAASAAAPVSPTDPARIYTLPQSPLCASGSRRGSRRAQRRLSIR